MKAKSKGRYQGLLNDLKELTIDRDATYVATDGAENSITNAQMAQAVSDNKAAAFYQVGNTYICIDSGTYTQNHIYKFTGAGWEDVTPIPAFETIDETALGRQINFSTDLEVGHLYSISFIQSYYRGETTRWSFSSGTTNWYLVYKYRANYVILLNCNLNYYGDIFASYYNYIRAEIDQTNGIYFTNVEPVSMLNSVNGKIGAEARADIYAPTTSGTSGQFLKSNGVNAAPTWVNDTFVHTTGDETIGGTKTFLSAPRFSNGINVLGGYGIDTTSNTDLVLKRYSTSQLKVTSTGLAPTSNNAKDLGNGSYYFKDLYIKGNLKDGTNNISLADIAAKSTVSVSDTGTATDEVKYITVNGVQKKIGGEGITVITLTGTSGTISDTDFAKIQANPSAVVFSLNGRKYTHNEDASTYISYSNVIYPTVDSQDAKVIYINTESTAVNYKTWSLETETPGGSVNIDNVSITENDDDEIQTIGVIDQNTGNANKEWTGTRDEYEALAVKDNNTTYYITDDDETTKLEVIDIGSTSTTIETITYPTMTKAVLDSIYTEYTAGKALTLHWLLLGIHTYFTVVYSTDINGYEINIVSHGKITKYNWNNQTDTLVIPTVEGGGNKYTHNITMRLGGSQGYVTFQIKDNNITSYDASRIEEYITTHGYNSSTHALIVHGSFYFNDEQAIGIITSMYRSSGRYYFVYTKIQVSSTLDTETSSITNTYSSTNKINSISSYGFSDYVVEE